MLLLWILAFSLSGTAGVLAAISLYFLFSKKRQETVISHLISYATGTLLTAALLGLIPDALHHASPRPIFLTVLLGILFFFLLEKIVIWRHCHDAECEVHTVAGSMILVGDTFHNAIDGVVIAASFLFSIPLGVVTSLSVIAHEIPQEAGDFAILFHTGYTRKKALLLNVLSSLSASVAAVAGYFALETVEAALPYVMGLSAASFLYIALADLSPELHQKRTLEDALRQFLLIAAGVLTIVVLLQFHSD